jgi:ComF family protein
LLGHDLIQLIIDVNPAHSFAFSPRPLIIAMPLHKKRLQMRGFNQSEILARAFSSLLHFPLAAKALERIRNTPSQRGLNREKRKTNICGAFRAQSDLVAGRSIVLVDDVCTSGATLQEAVDELIKAGAKKVLGLCIARAPLHHWLLPP